MSVPHTGKLKAIVGRAPCEFDGESWTSPNQTLAELLNAFTDIVPKTHYTIQEVATAAVTAAGLTEGFRILTAENDAWPEDLPPDAID